MDRRRPELTRRGLLLGAAGVAAGWLLRPHPALAGSSALTDVARRALAESPLVYISPLKSDGAESQCHGEVWFVTDGDDVLLVTARDRWRSRAVERGLTRARIWAGDFGVWSRNRGAWTKGPSFDARAGFERDPAAHAKALASFGRKYPDEWDEWGPRFEKGLADGSRVMVRYRPAPASDEKG